MMCRGIIIEYDGYTGKIKTEKQEFIFLTRDVKKGEIINIGDQVYFAKEIRITTDSKVFIARFISKS